jgi:adenosylhomocysteine nucleosidase
MSDRVIYNRSDNEVMIKMNGDEILLVCALEIETQGKLDNWNTLYSGVGKVNATFKLTERLTDYNWAKPKLIINYGTAGSRDLPIGELVDCTKFIQRDMDVRGLGFMKCETPFEKEIPIILDYDHVQFNPIGKKLRCGTGDNFVQDYMVRSGYAYSSYSDVFDMEAYALAKVCFVYDVPFIAFKYITDNANESSPKDWEENCSDGIKVFKDKVLNCVEG